MSAQRANGDASFVMQADEFPAKKGTTNSAVAKKGNRFVIACSSRTTPTSCRNDIVSTFSARKSVYALIHRAAMLPI
jgi:hypothetical protein